MSIERLVGCAIKRDGVWRRGCQSHWELRMVLDPANPDEHPGDVAGFVTTTDRYVERLEGRDIAIACGQLGEQWKEATRKVLSSDINWREGRR